MLLNQFIEDMFKTISGFEKMKVFLNNHALVIM